MTSAPGFVHPCTGQGMWIWQVDLCEGGNPDTIAQTLCDHNFSWVVIKAADGVNVWDQFTWRFVNALRGYGLRVGGWHYVRGSWVGDGIPEADAACAAMQSAPDFWVVDAEDEVEQKNTGPLSQGTKSMDSYLLSVSGRFPRVPLYLSSFPISTYHPNLPYETFGKYCKGFMPQVYWNDLGRSVSDAIAWTAEVEQVDKRLAGIDVIPTGQVYTVGNDDVLSFGTQSHQQWPIGLSWWSYQHVPNPSYWDTMKKCWPEAPKKVDPKKLSPLSPGPHAFSEVRYEVVEAQMLRTGPRAFPNFPPFTKQLEPVGAMLTYAGQWTPNWRYCRDGAGNTGWMLVSNIAAI